MWRRFAFDDARQPVVKAALDTLLKRGEAVYISAQNLIEFQSLATRPANVNGLGLTTAQASEKAQEIETLFAFLPDTAAIYPHWRTLIERYDVKGKQVHDARLVAVMLAHGIRRLMTFNTAHFARFSEISVLTPQDVC